MRPKETYFIAGKPLAPGTVIIPEDGGHNFVRHDGESFNRGWSNDGIELDAPALWHAQFPVGAEVLLDREKRDTEAVVLSLEKEGDKCAFLRLRTSGGSLLQCDDNVAKYWNLRLRAKEPKDWRDRFPIGSLVRWEEEDVARQGQIVPPDPTFPDQLNIDGRNGSHGAICDEAQSKYHRLVIVDDDTAKPAPPQPKPETVPQMPSEVEVCKFCGGTRQILELTGQRWPCPRCTFIVPPAENTSGQWSRALCQIELPDPMAYPIHDGLLDPHVTRDDGSVEIGRAHV